MVLQDPRRKRKIAIAVAAALLVLLAAGTLYWTARDDQIVQPPPEERADAAIEDAATATASAGRREPGPPDLSLEKEEEPKIDASKRRIRGRDISAAEIRDVVQRHAADISACYQKSDARLLPTKLNLTLTVEPSGRVSAAKLATRAKKTDAATCLTLRARKWRFKAPGGTIPQEVTVPIIRAGR
jgi:hypothetical protein